jgi:hypothetical protein
MKVEMKICETCSRTFVRPVGSKVRDCGTHRRAEFATQTTGPQLVKNASGPWQCVKRIGR